MKILVTGLSGLVGSRFQQLFGNRYSMVNLDLTNGVDITNPANVDQVFASNLDATAIIHLAAFTNVSAAYEQEGQKNGTCYKVNVIGSKTIAEAAAKYNKYLIHVSTDYVFDGNKLDGYYTETDTPHPIEWYGQTKLWAEEEVTKAGPKHVIVRLAFPYQSHPARPDFLIKMIDHMKNNTLPPTFTDHIITPTFVDDVTRVFDYCSQNQPIGLYHMVGSSSHSDYEIATMVKAVFGILTEVKPGSLEEYLKKVNRPYQKIMRVSNTKLQHDFGITMHTLHDGLQEIKKQLS